MKSKQLANVLIKIIGLYTCLCAIPSLIVGISAAIGAALFAVSGGTKLSNDVFAYNFPIAIGAAIQFMVGMYLVSKSRKVADYWFKDEDE